VNVAIFPIQLLNRTAPLPPIPIPFPEAEFEDCFFSLNTRCFSHIQNNNNGTHVDDDATSCSSSSSDGYTMIAISNGKRKATPDNHKGTKRQRMDDEGILILPSTVCRFDVLNQLEDANSLMAKLRDVEPGQTILEEITALKTVQLPGREDDSWMKSALQVYDNVGNIAVTLPIVDTDMVPLEREPHRFTNGKWLESMVALCEGATGKRNSDLLHVYANLKVGEKTKETSWKGEDTWSLELHLDLHLSLSKLSPASSSTPPWLADHVHRLIRFCYPNDEFEREARSHGDLTASLIYSLLPSSKLPPLEEMQPFYLNPTLFPFQKRSVNFLLGREGKKYSGVDEYGNATVDDIDGVMTHTGIQQLGLWWQQIDNNLYFNPVLGKMTREVKDTYSDRIQGGILAEEMGLGKTVEVIALILLNRDEDRSKLPSYYDSGHELEISPTKTTLIVAPETLRQQWLDEIALHAPHLRTFSYLGYTEASKQVPRGMEWREYSKQFDIMVASFDTLKREINVARKAPNRSRRFERKYERPRSLLIQLSFHRVVMDEVQLVGHSSAAETVSLIDRHYSLAVSGTPVKMINDLKSLFHFLRVLTPSTGRHWSRMQSPALIPSLASCFGMLTTRHTKSQVRSEMTLPAQTRVLVPINFTAIESAFYRDINAKVLQGTGVDPSEFGSTNQLLYHLRNLYDGDLGWLHNTLVSLRQACTHPQIAGSHARGANYSGTALATSNTIRSMDEVLTIMIEGTKADQALHWQQLVRKQINRAVLLLQDKENEARLTIAREMLTALAKVIEGKANGVKEDWKNAAYVGPLYKFTKAEVEVNKRHLNESIDGAIESSEMDHIAALAGGSSTQAERERDHDLAERRIHKQRHVQNLSNRWRIFMEQLHRALHFLGNTHFQLGEVTKALQPSDVNNVEKPDEVKTSDESNSKVLVKNEKEALSISDSPEVIALKKKEDESYDRAEEVRQTLLKLSKRGVEGAIASLDKSPPVDFNLVDLVIDIDFGQSGIHTEDIFDRLNTSQDLLNSQIEVISQWRRAILERICKPVSRDVSDEDEDDDQYQENLDAQSEAEVLTEMYRVLLSERDFVITGVRVEGSMSKPALYVELERHFQTQKRLKFLRISNPDDENVLRQMENAPTEQQEEVMKLQLDHFKKLEREKDVSVFNEENSLQPSDDEEAVRFTGTRRQKQKDKERSRLNSCMALEVMLKELRELHQKKDGAEELAIMRMAMDKLRSIIASQKLKCEKLKREHLSFMAVFNARSAYFKHMQQLSDDVADIVTSNVRKEIRTLEEEEVDLKRREEKAAGRLRYLTAIEEEEVDGRGEGLSKETSSRACVICTEPLVKAVIFNTCGHSTCENCFKNWTSKRGQCPMCKAKVMMRDVYRVTYGKDSKNKKRQVQLPQAEKRKMQQERYNVISEDLIRSMSVMPIRSALGTKLDLLTRHLLYIEHTKPGTKSLIFTAFSRGITLVGDALRLNNINHVTMDQGGQRGARIIDTFKNSPTVNVLLLHSEAQSSGLNLTCAENVFLLEPLVNHSIELQAIGRVHRIGQSRETTVYVYQVNDTVEERIVHLATGRGQSLITRENCVSKDLKDSAEMAAKTQEGMSSSRSSVKTKEAEFVASIEEVFHCLFDDDVDHGKGKDGTSSTTPISTNVSPIKREEEERERLRRERVEAIERRQAMASIELERHQQHRK